MALAATSPKQQAHELIDRLSTGQASAAVIFINAMLDPVEIALANAPYDDEPLTVEEIKALDASREWLKHNEGIAHEQVLAELGITQEEIDNYKEPQ
jgi:spermidine/putrescine-binding protein